MDEMVGLLDDDAFGHAPNYSLSKLDGIAKVPAKFNSAKYPSD